MTALIWAGESWQGRAACAGQDVRVFFTRDPADAKAICCPCPVRAECLHDALLSGAPNGIWGGLTIKERDKLPALPSPAAAAIAALREVLAAYDPPDEGTSPPMASNAEPREDVAEMLRQGATYREIISELGVSAHVVSATRSAYNIPLPVGPGRRRSPQERAANEKRTIELLQGGATYQQIKDEVGISAPTIIAIRRKAGLPDPGHRGAPEPRTIAEGLAASVEPYGDGHARWTGPMTGRMPQLHADGQRFNARHVLFEQHRGRPPVGYVRSDCRDQACVAGAHLTDDLLRNPPAEEEPVTVQALHDLLDEIDAQGGPQAARDNRLHLPAEPSAERTHTPMPATTTTTAAAPVSPIPQATAEALPVGRLLKWGDEHPDAEVRDQAARARVVLAGLRKRHAADQELTAITTEAEHLEKRLAELRAREQELAPPKTKAARKKQELGYDSPTVRAWARDNGVDCPPTGRIPKTVVDQWKAATGPTCGGPS